MIISATSRFQFFDFEITSLTQVKRADILDELGIMLIDLFWLVFLSLAEMVDEMFVRFLKFIHVGSDASKDRLYVFFIQITAVLDDQWHSVSHADFVFFGHLDHAI
jgi:hypothetical protein